jgi:hypothetical protein
MCAARKRDESCDRKVVRAGVKNKMDERCWFIERASEFRLVRGKIAFDIRQCGLATGAFAPPVIFQSSKRLFSILPSTVVVVLQDL